VFAAGFVAGQGSDWRPGFLNRDMAVFTQPTVERAARTALGKADGEPVLKSDLRTVTSMFFWGDHTPASREEFDRMFNERPDEAWGTMTSLEDLTMFENLSLVRFYRQPITDVSPLASLKRLGEVTFQDCDVADISPLAALPRLESICIHNILATDFSCIAGMTKLRNLDIGNMPLESLNVLGAHASMDFLSVWGSGITNLNGIEAMPRLTGLDIANTAVEDLSPLDGLELFESLKISLDMEARLKPQLESLAARGVRIEMR
jgi:Leucine-rich repeat (LRR) protein